VSKVSDIAAPVHLAGVVLQHHRHLCAFFHTPEERYRVLFPFTSADRARYHRSVSGTLRRF
jgi:hypothetical protein